MTTPFPGPCSVLVLDNARIHHAQDIKDLIHNYGTLVLSIVTLSLILLIGCRLEFYPHILLITTQLNKPFPSSNPISDISN